MADREGEWQEAAAPRATSYNTRVYRPNTGGYNRGARGRSNESNWRQRGNFSGGGRNQPRQEEGNKKIITVPSPKVGRIIGKGGSKTRELEFKSESKVKVGDSIDNKTTALIGSDEAVDKVQKMINDLLKDYNLHTRNQPRQEEGNKKIITVPSPKVGRIIGKGGSKTRELEFKSESKVKVGDSIDNKTTALIGSDEAVDKVQKMINDLLKDYNLHTRNQPRQEEGNKKIITVPSPKVGRIIGKGGSKTRELEFKSESKVKVGDSIDNKTTALIGSDEAVDKVQKMINDLLKDYNLHTRNQPRQEEGNKKIITVPSPKVGRIIGKGGSKTRELEFKSESKVKVGDSIDNKTTALIGSDEAVDKVQKMINDLLKDYNLAPT